MNDSRDGDNRRHNNRCEPATAPMAAPFPPYPPYPPFAPFPPYPPYPPYPPTPPCQPPGGQPPGAGGAGGLPAPGGGPGTGGGPPLVFPASIDVRRPDDLLVCTIRFTGFAFMQDPPRLDRAADDAYITVEFPPQSFGEEAFLLAKQSFDAGGQQVEVTQNPDYPPRNVPGADDAMPPSLPAARIRMATPSRVVVAMPAAQDTVSFDLPSMLAARARLADAPRDRRRRRMPLADCRPGRRSRRTTSPPWSCPTGCSPSPARACEVAT